MYPDEWVVFDDYEHYVCETEVQAIELARERKTSYFLLRKIADYGE